VGKLLKPQEVADLLGVSTYTLLEWRRSGFGPRWLRLRGNDLRYSSVAVAEFVSSREVSSLAEERAKGRRYNGAAETAAGFR